MCDAIIECPDLDRRWQGRRIPAVHEPFWVAADGNGQAGPVPLVMVNDYPSSSGPDADFILEVRVQRTRPAMSS
jgi:hypothetical protein